MVYQAPPKDHASMVYQAPPKDGQEALARLQDVVKSGKPIVGAGAGVGISAKFIEQGGADLLILCQYSVITSLEWKHLFDIFSIPRQFWAV
jgi:predicted TIM-barrel enzyme